ncbi:MAG: alpha/beta hydrolase [Erysipelotrichaceae bacterium]|nr:alpha/beta hydrolase [Erysipelotrichaceae bacterium]
MLIIGILSTVFLVLFGVAYSLLLYNVHFQNWLIETLSAKANVIHMKDESQLKGKRFMVPRENRDVRVNIYRGKEGKLPAVFFAHGSDFVDSDADEWDDYCDWFAKEFQVLLISVNYSKIGIHVTSYPQDEIQDTIRWFRSHADEYGFDKNEFMMMGAEAGAYLSMIAGFQLLRKGIFSRGYILINPFVDYTNVSFAQAGYHPEPVALITLGEDRMREKWNEYSKAIRAEDIYMREWDRVHVSKRILYEPYAEFDEQESEDRRLLINWLHVRMNEFI